MSELTPPDLGQCQAIKPNGHTFMTLGGRPGMERCKSKPVWLATENHPGAPGAALNPRREDRGFSGASMKPRKRKSILPLIVALAVAVTPVFVVITLAVVATKLFN